MSRKASKQAVTVEAAGPATLTLKYGPPPTGAIDAGPVTAYRTFSFAPGLVVNCLDGGDVELSYVGGGPVTFDDGIILRWGRKR